MPHREHHHVDNLDKSLQHLSDKNQDIIVCRDFNCPDVDWDSVALGVGANNRAVQPQEKMVEIAQKPP